MQHSHLKETNSTSGLHKIVLLCKWFMARLSETSWNTFVVILIGIALAIALRYTLLDFKSVDYFNERVQSYHLIKAMGFSALANSSSNYNPPFFYLLYLVVRFFPDLPMVIAVKLPALIADFVCAYFVYRIVKLKYPDKSVPYYAGLVVLLTPTVAINSAFWGQVDSLHTAGLLACIYFLLAHKNGWAVLAFGVALAFKLQAIFLAPLLFALFLRREITWKPFLLVPLVLLLALMPAWIAGRPLSDLLNIYAAQTSQYEALTLNAPSIYAWLPETKQLFHLFYTPGVIMGTAMAFLLAIFIYKSKNNTTQQSVVELALMTLLVVPFFLPKMHERYFYPADALSVAFAFYFPRLFYVPILIEGVSFFSYQPFLFERQPIPISILTAVLLFVIGILFYHTALERYSSVEQGKPTNPVSPDQPADAVK